MTVAQNAIVEKNTVFKATNVTLVTERRVTAFREYFMYFTPLIIEFMAAL